MVALAPGVARAACPGDFNGKTCDGGTGGDVCTLSGGGFVVTCDLGVSSDTYGSDAKFVSPSTTGFRAYGYEGDGEAFCCEKTVAECDNPITVYIYGTYEVDVIDLNDQTDELSLDCSTAWVYGEDENDTITGSLLTTNFDRLYGDQDDDVIRGMGGDDYCEGGTGNDRLEGGADDDTLKGGNNDDELDGGDGDDYLYGESGADELCGRWGADSLYGGDDVDWVFGGPGDDAHNDGGNSASDTCENDSPNLCESTTASVCPF